MTLPSRVHIMEVGPRDGLQNEPDTIPTEIKRTLIEQLVQAGLTRIEVASFVSPKWVPQMADHTEIMQATATLPRADYYALVPNEQGLNKALNSGATHLSVFTTCSETFSQKNTNCSIAESMKRIQQITNQANENKIPVRAYISCTLGCPYEGKTQQSTTVTLARQLYELGCHEIVLSDTIGTGNPNSARQLIEAVSQHIPMEHIAIHFHDTYGQALANIYACLTAGITHIDAAVAGLGGCPYAPGAGGNVATEDVVYLCEGLGIDTGIDIYALTKAGQVMTDYLNISPRSKAAYALQKATYCK